MLFRIQKRLCFLLTSTNEHGVHSPFVFDLVTKCLYQPKRTISLFKKSTNQQIILEYKLDQYFSPKRKIIIQKNTSELSGIYNCILLTQPDEELFLKAFAHMDNDSFIVIKNHYKNAKAYDNWLKLIRHKHTTVSIDLYHIGLIFIRKEQRKQHFTIRT